ncbi:SIP domain-containing protein [Amycolatopsis sp. NPDC051128]|uniref:SIP domain-containing protein n=1 Tax=Amycolatopsis sp. NPDC051128 TaxID=3155412 RepID=UPI0034447025
MALRARDRRAGAGRLRPRREQPRHAVAPGPAGRRRGDARQARGHADRPPGRRLPPLRRRGDRAVAAAAIVRALPASARVLGVFEADEPDGDVPVPRGAQFRRVHRHGAGAAGSRVLADGVAGLDLPRGADHGGVAYLTGEARTIQAVRRVLDARQARDGIGLSGKRSVCGLRVENPSFHRTAWRSRDAMGKSRAAVHRSSKPLGPPRSAERISPVKQRGPGRRR